MKKLYIGLVFAVLAFAQRKGQTELEVNALLGEPSVKYNNGVYLYHGGTEYAPTQVFITYSKGKVKRIKVVKLYASGPSRLDTAVNNILQGAQYIALMKYCPEVARKPYLFWTPEDAQVYQACLANGYYLGSLYIYTGGQRQ